MLRIIKTSLSLALITLSGVAHAEYTGGDLGAAEPVSVDTVTSIGATTTMSEYEAVVSAPSRGKIVATANADVFCSGDETARTIIIDVEQPGPVTLDICETHLDQRTVMIRFVPEA